MTPLKSSLSLGCKLRKRIVLQRRMVFVLLSAVDVRRTIMYGAWLDNICLESTSLPPKAFQNVLLISIAICISCYLHFLFKCTLFEDLCHSQSRLFTTKYYVNVFTYILNNFRCSKLEERRNKNKPTRNNHVGQKSAEIKLAPFSVGKLYTSCM